MQATENRKTQKQIELENTLLEIIRSRNRPCTREIARIYAEKIGKREMTAAEAGKIYSKVSYRLNKVMQPAGMVDSSLIPDEKSRLGRRIWLKRIR